MSFDTTNPPLPPDAARESGNLAVVMQALRQLIDLNTQILMVLQASYVQHAVVFGIEVPPSNLPTELNG